MEEGKVEQAEMMKIEKKEKQKIHLREGVI